MALTDQQEMRYARHIILDEVGEEGQERLLASKVLVVGAGGLGSPLLMYLAAAGVGTLGVVDDDTVEITNLQRQIAHVTASLGRPKVDSAADMVAALNPGIAVVRHALRLGPENAEAIIKGYDLVADGTDNFDARYLLNDICYKLKKPLVSASLYRFEGQLTTYTPFRALPGSAEHGPCLRCLFPDKPPPDLVPRCETAGILGAVAGVLGTLQATEVLKELLGLGESMNGRLLMYDALSSETRIVKLKRDPHCKTCGAG
ncbi:MAG: molybdopterin-synthase adenylyltransferase MoeB [Alphaproteobacteria bacterium]|nr:molybdopterin-synthase adenylyltransferase MoeB [Alphaproteobacteria bacterium]